MFSDTPLLPGTKERKVLSSITSIAIQSTGHRMKNFSQMPRAFECSEATQVTGMCSSGI